MLLKPTVQRYINAGEAFVISYTFVNLVKRKIICSRSLVTKPVRWTPTTNSVGCNYYLHYLFRKTQLHVMAVSKPTSGCVVNYKVVQEKGKVVP